MSEREQSTASADIAIVGMACLFPGAPNLEAYWHNIVTGVESIAEPPDEWSQNASLQAGSGDGADRLYTRRGGYLGAHAGFDPARHGIMPVAAAGGEPDQWLALQVASDALADAGYDGEVAERERTAVIIGKGGYLSRGNTTQFLHGEVVDQTIRLLHALHPEYTPEELLAIKRELKQELPPFGVDTVPGLIPNIVASRIANRFDLHGPSYIVDGACASSLLALEAAVQGLRSREFDLALVGGVHTATSVSMSLAFCQLGAYSRAERIRPFDRDADGILPGEGIGMVVLKRADDARQAGQRAYATIKGVGVASDGRGVGVMAPRVEGQVIALQRAYRAAALDPSTVGLLEAHGTGTPAGDAAEIEALVQVVGPRPGALPTTAIGSVKSMIGHLMPAAGIAGLIKTALALHHKVLPPTLGVEAPHATLDGTALYANGETRPWIHPDGGAPRRAGVSAFGFGGINAHVVLEEVRETAGMPLRVLSREWDSELFILAAETREALLVRASRLEAFVRSHPTMRLRDLAFSVNTPFPEGTSRLALVATSLADLEQKLALAQSTLADGKKRSMQGTKGVYFTETPLAASGSMAFLFPGEGSQYAGQLADLCMHFPEVRRIFDESDAAAASHGLPRPSEAMFPRAGLFDADRTVVSEQLWQMSTAIACVLGADLALFTLLDKLGVKASSMVGHSTGEFAALIASGMMQAADGQVGLGGLASALASIPFEDGAEVEPSMALVAIGADPQVVGTLVGDEERALYIAMKNCPHQTVVAGAVDAVDALISRLRARGLVYQQLSFDRPYHTPLFDSFAAPLREFTDRWVVSAPQTPVYSCASAGRFPWHVEGARELAVSQWTRPVEFQRTIEAMYADGVRLFVEVGPRGNLCAFVDDILRGRAHAAIPANVTHRSGITGLHHLLASLAVHGVPMTLDHLYTHRQPKRVDIEHGDADSANGDARVHDANRNGLTLKTTLPSLTLPTTAAARLRAARSDVTRDVPVDAVQGSPAQVVSAYLRNMEQFLSIQQEVMTTFLAGRTSETAATGHAEVAAPIGTANVASRSEAVVPATTPAATPPGQESSAGPRDPMSILLRVVSERTGYPPEMLDGELDLEADLGIDSIKRVEILGAFRREAGLTAEGIEAMGGLRSLRQFRDHFAAAQIRPDVVNAATPSFDAASMPLLGTVIAYSANRELVALRTLDEKEDLLLRDHTFSRNPSVFDTTLCALPVMPLTGSMEMMAEAASALCPGLRVVGMRDIRAHRWVVAEPAGRAIEIVATRRATLGDDAGDRRGHVEVDVRLFDQDDTGGASDRRRSPLVEGVMVLADAYPTPPQTPESAVAERDASIPSAALYDIMFHGPAFRGVQSVDMMRDDGATGTLATLPRDRLFRSMPNPQFITEPVLLDQLGQMLGFWLYELIGTIPVALPFRLSELHLFGPSPAAGATFQCRLYETRHSGSDLQTDGDIVDAQGRVWARFTGWQDRCFNVPEFFTRFTLDPREVMLSEPFPSMIPDVEGMSSTRRIALDKFPDGFFSMQGSIWQRVLSRTVLSRRERHQWDALRLPPARSLEWLLGRVAAKDAVRSLIARQDGLQLASADVEIDADAGGALRAGGVWTSRVVHVPAVSISHANGVAIAVAFSGASVGIDLEQVASMNDDVSHVAFSSHERELLASLPQSEQWLLRAWCAKEAVAKATGIGRSTGPQSLVVEHADAMDGTVHVRPARVHAAPSPATATGAGNGSGVMTSVAEPSEALIAATVRDGNTVIAVATSRQKPTRSERES